MAVAPRLIKFKKAKGKFTNKNLSLLSGRETLGELLQGLSKFFSQKIF